MILVKSDAVPVSLFLRIKRSVESETFPWFYTPTTAYTAAETSVENLYNGSFGHIALDNGRKNSEYSDILEAALLTALDGFGIELKTLHRIRVGFIPVCPVQTINPPHVDMVKPHKVGLLYLDDSDGDTIIYNEKYDPLVGGGPLYNDHRDILWYYEKDLGGQVSVMQKISPEKNKMIVFDGYHYHSSSSPTKTKRRIAVNYVFD